jgi:hypothetical protein
MRRLYGILYPVREWEAGSLNEIKLPSEGGTRSCFPSEVSLGQKRRVFESHKLEHTVSLYCIPFKFVVII